MLCLPLTFCGLSVIVAGTGGWRAVAALEGGPGLGWSGRAGGRSAGSLEAAAPFGLVMPAFGEVEHDVSSAVAGGAGGDRNQVVAQDRDASFRESQAGQGTDGAHQVMGDSGDGQPGGVGGELPGGRWASEPSLRSAKACSTMA